MALRNLVYIVEKACRDSRLRAHLAMAPDEATKGLGLTEEEKQAIFSWASDLESLQRHLLQERAGLMEEEMAA